MKMNKTLIILSLLLVFCISLSAVSATEDISVNDTNDDSVATVESSVMNEEINTVNNGKIRMFSEIFHKIESRNVFYITDDYLIDGTCEIQSNVIIYGNNHTIYGNGKQAFIIHCDGVIIRDLNFVNCSAKERGGAIYFEGRGKLVNCNFVNCSKSKDGGAIYFGGNGELHTCSFVNCSASTGGAIYFGGKGELHTCSFVNCSAKNYMYSAIYDINKVTVENCSFVNCKGNDNNGSTPLFKPKVILNVDDIKGVNGSTVKVNVGVHDILGTPINEGTVTISLNGKDYTAKVVDGIATFNIIIPSKEGIYTAKVLFNAEGTRYDNTTCDFTVTSVEDNTEDINKSVVSNNMENCGTPLVALLIALISLPIIRRK